MAGKRPADEDLGPSAKRAKVENGAAEASEEAAPRDESAVPEGQRKWFKKWDEVPDPTVKKEEEKPAEVEEVEEAVPDPAANLDPERFEYNEELDLHHDKVFDLMYDVMTGFYYDYRPDGETACLHWNEFAQCFQRVNKDSHLIPERKQTETDREYLERGEKIPGSDQEDPVFRVDTATFDEESGRYLDEGIGIWWDPETDLFQQDEKPGLFHWNIGTHSYQEVEDAAYEFPPLENGTEAADSAQGEEQGSGNEDGTQNGAAAMEEDGTTNEN